MNSPRTIISVFLIIISIFFLGSCAGAQQPAGGALGITSLVASQSQTFPGGDVHIQSMVNNPHNETLLFKWACTGGNFTDSGPNNTWVAPPQYGNYDITLTVEDGKGGKAQSTVSIVVGANKPPVINSLTSSQANVSYGATTNLTCDAFDPDGDALRYSWSASEGSISGIGKTVTWTGPNKGGEFSITAIVSDGKAESRSTVVMRVVAATSATTIPLIRNESGTVSSTGDKDTSKFKVGDDEKGTGYRCFFSFNIFGLNGTEVRDAKVRFSSARVTGDPFAPVTGLNGLRFWKIRYGAGLPDFNFIGEALDRASALFTSAPSQIDVTPEIVNLVASGAERFQLEALFDKMTNGNSIAQYVEYSDAVLEVTFAPK
ncbi:MAG: hypothetical protein PHO26_03610 [Dehalococcoidia bacterium]|nr:hypothetical protein [Dehalococcoidia bacterium]MDD5494835.1 hypothetical protein [Dehalococcoidia bacterium]